MRTAIVLLLIPIALLSQTASDSTALLEGIVTNELTGSPLGGVEIMLIPDLGAPQSVISDSNGQFVFRGIPAGRYTLKPTLSGFFTARRSPGPANLTFGIGERINAHLVMIPQGVISGKVLDENGQGLENAVVVAVRPRFENGRRVLTPCSPESKARTDEEGNYRLFNLEPGTYYLAMSASSACVSQYYPNATDPSDAVPISVPGGRETGGIQLHMSTSPRYSIRFRVDQQPPLSNAPESNLLQVIRKTRSGLSIEGLFPVGATNAITRSAQGEFVASGFTRGDYDVYYVSDRGRELGMLTFSILDRDIDLGTLTVLPAATISGVVLAKGSFPPGWSVQTLQIRLKPIDGRDTTITMRAPTSRVGKDGRFGFVLTSGDRTVGTIAAGTYLVEVLGLPSGSYLASIKYDGRYVPEGTVQAPFAHPLSSLEVEVVHPAGSIDGIVRDARDEPAGDSLVVLIPSTDRRGNFGLFRTARADQAGRFIIRDVPPGSYGLLAWQEVESGAYQNTDFLKGFEGRSVPTNVTAGARTSKLLKVVPAGSE